MMDLMNTIFLFLVFSVSTSAAFGDCFKVIEASQAEYAVKLKALYAQNPMASRPTAKEGVISGFSSKDAYKKEVRAMVENNEKEYKVSMDACRMSKGLKDY
jgi:hypothetical protein